MNPREHELSLLEQQLVQSNTPVDLGLKKRVYEILSIIQYGARKERYEMPGMLVILGYDESDPWHSEHYSEPDKTQNIFKYRAKMPDASEVRPAVDVMDDNASGMMLSTKDFDGAILITSDGFVADSGIYLRKIDPVDVLEEMEVENDRDLSTRFGFFDKVHARHLAAICASYHMPRTTTYTLSQERGILRVFEEGRIVYSQIGEECGIEKGSLPTIGNDVGLKSA